MEMIGVWLPFIILIGVVLFLIRAGNRQYRVHVDEVNAVNQQIADTNREMIAELKEIKQILKDQS